MGGLINPPSGAAFFYLASRFCAYFVLAFSKEGL